MILGNEGSRGLGEQNVQVVPGGMRIWSGLLHSGFGFWHGRVDGWTSEGGVVQEVLASL